MKSIYRLALILITFCLFTRLVYAQQTVVYAHYNYMPIEYNSAYAGFDGGTTLSGIYRQQWVNFPGNPMIFQLSCDFSILRKAVGLALSYQNNYQGAYLRQKMISTYSYKIPINRHGTSFVRVGVGVQAEYYSKSSELNIISPDNVVDPVFKSLSRSKFSFNVGTGVLLQVKKFIFGVSAPVLIENNTLYNSDYLNAYSTLPIFSHLSIVIKFTEGFSLTPMTLLRYENSVIGIDNSLKIKINNMIIFGVNYRYLGDIGITIGLIMNASLRLGYGYEPNIISSDTKTHSGTHEIMFKYKIFKKNYKLDSPRYLQ